MANPWRVPGWRKAEKLLYEENESYRRLRGFRKKVLSEMAGSRERNQILSGIKKKRNKMIEVKLEQLVREGMVFDE